MRRRWYRHGQWPAGASYVGLPIDDELDDLAAAKADDEAGEEVTSDD